MRILLAIRPSLHRSGYRSRCQKLPLRLLRPQAPSSIWFFQLLPAMACFRTVRHPLDSPFTGVPAINTSKRSRKCSPAASLENKTPSTLCSQANEPSSLPEFHRKMSLTVKLPHAVSMLEFQKKIFKYKRSLNLLMSEQKIDRFQY